MLMLDLGSGLGGASQVMVERGWQVVTVDINPEFEPDIISDLREWSWNGSRPDLIWCSPPCTEFSKFAMPCWYNPVELQKPDMSIITACRRIINECQPHFWVIENVRGAVTFFEPILGKPAAIFRPYYLWGHFPNLGRPNGWSTKTKTLPSSAKPERAKIPLQISRALALAIEFQISLPEFYMDNVPLADD